MPDILILQYDQNEDDLNKQHLYPFKENLISVPASINRCLSFCTKKFEIHFESSFNSSGLGDSSFTTNTTILV